VTLALLPQVRQEEGRVSPTSVKRQRVGKEMVQWSYGVGEEGLRLPDGIRRVAILIDSIFPCWWSASKSVGLNVSKIWLTSQFALSSDYIKVLTGKVPIDTGPAIPDGFWSEVEKCSFILIGGPFPKQLHDRRLWSSPILERIILTSGLSFKLPQGWVQTQHKLSHAEVGGVTDGIYNCVSIGRTSVRELVVYDKTPGQDLRAILKSGEPGRQSMNLIEPRSKQAATQVVFCGDGVIEEASLWPTGKPHVKVQTFWRKQFQIE
jgi:hypothetical protein